MNLVLRRRLDREKSRRHAETMQPAAGAGPKLARSSAGVEFLDNLLCAFFASNGRKWEKCPCPHANYGEIIKISGSILTNRRQHAYSAIGSRAGGFSA
jgi:hypothetical protein